jgi:hypothetical protein
MSCSGLRERIPAVGILTHRVVYALLACESGTQWVEPGRGAGDRTGRVRFPALANASTWTRTAWQSRYSVSRLRLSAVRADVGVDDVFALLVGASRTIAQSAFRTVCAG